MAVYKHVLAKMFTEALFRIVKESKNSRIGIYSGIFVGVKNYVKNLIAWKTIQEI